MFDVAILISFVGGFFCLFTCCGNITVYLRMLSSLLVKVYHGDGCSIDILVMFVYLPCRYLMTRTKNLLIKMDYRHYDII